MCRERGVGGGGWRGGNERKQNEGNVEEVNESEG